MRAVDTLSWAPGTHGMVDHTSDKMQTILTKSLLLLSNGNDEFGHDRGVVAQAGHPCWAPRVERPVRCHPSRESLRARCIVLHRHGVGAGRDPLFERVQIGRAVWMPCGAGCRYCLYSVSAAVHQMNVVETSGTVLRSSGHDVHARLPEQTVKQAGVQVELT